MRFASLIPLYSPQVFSCFQYLDKGFLRYIDRAKRFHSFFAFLLFLEQFAFARDIAAITFGGNVFAQGADGFASDDFATDGPLDGDGILLAGDYFFQFGGQGSATALGLITMDDAREGVHRLAVHEHVELHHVRRLVAGVFIIHRSVTAGNAFDSVVEINENFVERNHAGQHHPARIECFGVIDDSALFRNQRHHVADILVRTDDECFDHGLLDFVDISDFWQVSRVVHFLGCAIGLRDAIDNTGVGGNDIHAILAAEAFLNDFEMQQA